METNEERRRRLLEVVIKSSGRRAMADIPAADREMLEKRRAERVKEDATWTKRRSR